jgi:hypothetical protein
VDGPFVIRFKLKASQPLIVCWMINALSPISENATASSSSTRKIFPRMVSPRGCLPSAATVEA